MNKYLVSIIVPIYNSEKTIDRCLNSIIGQTYKNIEIILVDDGSTDNTKIKIDYYIKKDNRIKYFYKKNEGVSIARNFGIKKSKGEFLNFVDSDDEVDKEFINTMLKVCLEENVDIVRVNYYYSKIDNKNESIGFCENNNILENIILGKIKSFVWLLLIRKKCLENIVFKEDISYMEDKIFYIELFSKINKVKFLDIPLYYYYYNEKFLKDNSIKYIKNYLVNVNKVYNKIYTVYFNKNFVCSLAFAQINNCIYNIFCKSDNMNVSEIKKCFYECNDKFTNKISVTKNNSVYMNICAVLVNFKFFSLLKILYNIRERI